jgi:hypothetical protein
MKRRDLILRSAIKASAHISIIVSGADISVPPVVSPTKRKAPVLKHVPMFQAYHCILYGIQEEHIRNLMWLLLE